MNPLDDSNRRIVPRWRAFNLTAAYGELDHAAVHARRLLQMRHWREKIADFRRSPILENAIPLVEAFAVCSRIPKEFEGDCQRARALVTDARSGAPALARELGRSVMSLSNSRFDVIDPISAGAEVAPKLIASAKQNLSRDPRDVIEWVDRARIHAILGQTKRARHCIEVARLLAPRDRFVIRSAFRFFVHAEERDRALWLLRKSEATPSDPWLIAAEIAGSSLAKVKPTTARRARQIIDARNYRPSDISEMAAALATLEIENGAHIKAKKLFQLSLIEPNENAVAQAKWAEYYHHTGRVDASELNSPRAYEARAQQNCQKQEWHKSLSDTELWLRDQPFSAGPAIHGSFVASVVGDYQIAEWFARMGLAANADNPYLTNNLAVAIALQGDTRTASALIDQIERSDSPEPQQIVHMATRGLIAYREKRFADGRLLYRLATKMALHGKSYGLYVRAALNWLREEGLQFPDKAERLATLARQISRYSGELDTPPLLQQVEAIAAIARQSGRVAVDAEVNLPLPTGGVNLVRSDKLGTDFRNSPIRAKPTQPGRSQQIAPPAPVRKPKA